MVARPPLIMEVVPMTVADLTEVQAIERASFTTPWPPQAYRSEIETNRLASYLVVRSEGHVIAYAGVWLMVDEAHITTFAVHPAWRRRGVGEHLLLALLEVAIGRGATEATLEVRLSNLAARRLYEKYGFRPVGLRPRYYTDDNEDALIMTTEPLAGDAMRERLTRLRAELGDGGQSGPNPSGPEPAEPNPPAPKPVGQDLSESPPTGGPNPAGSSPHDRARRRSQAEGGAG